MNLFTLRLQRKAVKILITKSLELGITPEKYAENIIMDSLMPSTVTVKDVAKEAKVSPSAVSYALNGFQDEISTETMKRILAAAKKLGYRPNLGATALRKRRS